MLEFGIYSSRYFFSIIDCWYFFLFLHENICWGYTLELECPIQVLLMSTHNICFCGELRKLFDDTASYLKLWAIFTSQVKYSTINPLTFILHWYWSSLYMTISFTIIANYRIRSNYRTYPYKHTLMKFRSLQITASVHFIYFFIKAYVVGSHLNCINKSMQFKWVPTTYAFIKKIRKKNRIIIIK